MKIVIDIPENEYRFIKEVYEKNDIVESLYSYIYHGKPLPEHHGRLIDVDALEYEPYLVSKGNGMYEKVKGYFNIDDAPTIIEGSDAE